MRFDLRLRAALLLSTTVCGGAALAVFSVRAQGVIVPGTILPIQLDHSISSKTAKPGETFSGRLMQNAPLPDRGMIRAGAHVRGHIVDVDGASAGAGARVSLKIDSLVALHRTFPLCANLRAIASPLEVEEAQVPLGGSDRGTPPSAYTTVQVGGDVVYRGGGHVEREGLIVGEPVPDGVLAPLSENSEGQCWDGVGGNNLPQAWWVFSSDACGAYGYRGMKIVDAGGTNPDGTIIIASDRGPLDIRGGSGLLLRVNARLK